LRNQDSQQSRIAQALVALLLVGATPSFGRPRLTAELRATLHPPIRATGVRFTGLYAVSFQGRRIVEASRDPE
jgi:hypothetical protein